MASLQVRWPEHSATKQRALEDAKKMQKAVMEECAKAGKEAPRYQLSELIGKGSFGRVYKATSRTTGQLVAIKIIDIEESDTVNPKLADTYSDLLKEINALQLLSESGAKNINHVIEALPVGQSMWMITEYCAGGSVATLMKPTSPGGLQEKWIIPILREVAEAMRWVHGQGIIHRDLKCANVLVTEVGNVQLCDFGVAGIIETKFDKRTTFIGTPHWMPPELFDQSASYGTEVDIWAFGAMVYEIASGLPPNVTDGIDFSRLGSHLKQHTPRLEGDQYSPGLKDMVAYCLQQDPAKRPTIEQVQRHGYIFNTSDAYPTSTLAHLVRAFKMWESQGGDRRSLFSAGGAQGLSDLEPASLANDDWNFSTTAAFDQQVFDSGVAQDVYDVYGSNVDFKQHLHHQEPPRPHKGKPRRRPPPQLPAVKAPLEKVFDPNTVSNYEDNSRAYYGKPLQSANSDLPLRDESAPVTDVRESLIDLDASLHGSDLSDFVDLNTVRAGDGRTTADYDFADGSSHDKTPVNDLAEGNPNRRTQDWKFPVMPPPPSTLASAENFRFPAVDEPPVIGPIRPSLVHHPTEPIQPSLTFGELGPPKGVVADNRASMGSLIDLDMSIPDSSTDYTRPSTSHSDVGSMSGSELGAANPFELEKHASLYPMPTTTREPSIYVSDDSEYATALTDAQSHSSDGEPATRPPTAPADGVPPAAYGAARYSLSEFVDMDPEPISSPQTTVALKPPPFPAPPPAANPPDSSSLPHPHPPPAPPPPQARGVPASSASLLPPRPMVPFSQVMEGQASPEEVKNELRRMAMSLGDHLSYANAYISALPVHKGGGPMAALEPARDPP